jgi:hypothetical protein
VIKPGYEFDRQRAGRAVAFTDSIASAFDVPRLESLTYYLTSSVDEVYGIMGLESDVEYGSIGGAAQPVNRQIFAGIPTLGEEYRHELAHVILAPLIGPNTLYFASEGVPTWLGGTSGMDFPTAARRLATFLAQRPTMTLDSLMSRPSPAPEFYAAAAVLTEMAFDHGGVEAVKALLESGPTTNDFRAATERLLERPWSAIIAYWRERVMELGSVNH